MTLQTATTYRSIIAGAALLAISACTPVTEVRLFVTASLDDGSAMLKGETHGAPYGDGVVSLRSNSGPTCVGTYTHDNNRNGSGEFTCSDGQSGDFTFKTRGFSARGQGQIDGAPFTIVVKPTRQ